MSQAKLVSTAQIAKGCILQNFIDESKPEGSIERKYSLTSYDGEPDSEPFVIPMHWHKLQDEHMTVLTGSTVFTIDGKVVTMNAGDAMMVLPRYVVHGMKCIPGVKMVLQEYTNPTGDYKEEFFLDFLSPGSKGILHTMRAFWDGDVYPALQLPWFLGGKLVDQLFLFVIGGIAKIVLPPRAPLQELRKRNA